MKENPKLKNICIKCGVDLYATEGGFECQDYLGCKGIILPKETLQEWAGKEQQKQYIINMMKADEELGLYEEPKKETLEDVAKKKSKYLSDWENKQTWIDGFIDGAKWQQEPEQFFNDDRVKTLERGMEYLLKKQEIMYSEEEVKYLLEVQRGNCYVALLSHTKNDDIASVVLRAPEPGGRNGTWVK